ncbi:hypothetical protein H4S04_005064, partial [Coemansia sp. S16]
MLDIKHPPPVTVTVTRDRAPAVTVTALVKESMHPPPSDTTNASEKANAAFVILTRNKDLKSLRETLIQLEDRFNRRYHYPY